MDIRYQVFLSSTFNDLQEERRKVFDVLMKMNCIPAGMELFPAADDEQFEFIKRVIDNCDYYVLIIGGRYGSISSDGISFTRKEFLYATERGIRVISFLHEEPSKLSVEKSDIDSEKIKKLADFRSEVSQNRVVSYWHNAEDLSAKVILGLQNAISTYPAVGWVRGNKISSAESVAEILSLRKENEALKSDKKMASTVGPSGTEILSQGNETIEILYRFRVLVGVGTIVPQRKDVFGDWETCSPTWDYMFKSLGPYLLKECSSNELVEHVEAIIKVFDADIIDTRVKQISNKQNFEDIAIQLDMESFHSIILQFRALGLVTQRLVLNSHLWRLTNFGDNYLMRLRAIKKNNVL
jgi:Domain of unknown function (DUF4062)